MKIVFLGDSVTDAGKNRDAGFPVPIGQGYASMVAGRLGADEPGKYEFVNSGISGFRCTDIYSQIKPYCWNLKPDVVSLYVGVNDAMHEFQELHNGVETDRFRRIVTTMLSETKERFPGVKFILLGAFVLPGEFLDSCGREMIPEVQKRVGAMKAIAAEFSAPFISVQELMDSACRLAPSFYWSADGVHPTPAGHQLIADAWVRAFRENIVPAKRG